MLLVARVGSWNNSCKLPIATCTTCYWDLILSYSALGNDEPAVEEEYVYEPSGRRKAKVPPPLPRRSEL